MKYKAIKAV